MLEVGRLKPRAVGCSVAVPVQSLEMSPVSVGLKREGVGNAMGRAYGRGSRAGMSSGLGSFLTSSRFIQH